VSLNNIRKVGDLVFLEFGVCSSRNVKENLKKRTPDGLRLVRTGEYNMKSDL
jgi:hypothetical protein